MAEEQLKKLTQVRISNDIHKRLKLAAVELGVPMGDLIEDILRKHLVSFASTQIPDRDPGHSFAEVLGAMPNVGVDADFARTSG